jgi:hypothetical protein
MFQLIISHSYTLFSVLTPAYGPAVLVEWQLFGEEQCCSVENAWSLASPILLQVIVFKKSLCLHEIWDFDDKFCDLSMKPCILVNWFRYFGGTYQNTWCRNPQGSTLNLNIFPYAAVIFTLWFRMTHALRLRVQGSIPEWRSVCFPQLRPPLYKPIGSFPYALFFCKSLHENIQSRNLHPGVLQIAAETGVGTKGLNLSLMGQVRCYRLPLGVILPGQRHVGDALRNDLRLPNRHICVCARVLQLGHHVCLPGDVTNRLHEFLPSVFLSYVYQTWLQRGSRGLHAQETDLNDVLKDFLKKGDS